MWKEIITVGIVVYLYLCIIYHSKTVDDLDVYQMDEVDRSRIDHMCAFRQPFMFSATPSDEFLFRPALTVITERDTVSTGPFQYSDCYRTFIYGRCTVKVASPSAPVKVIKDHLYRKYYTEATPPKTVEVTLTDTMLFVPAYWWYQVEGTAVVLRYKTLTNVVATLPSIAMHVLQWNNVDLKPKDAPSALPSAPAPPTATPDGLADGGLGG